MGKVIAKKINGMSWTAKVSLVTLITLLTTVFMYEGWYLPRYSEAGAVTYNFTLDSSAVNLGADGSTSIASNATGAGKFSMITTTPATRSSNIGSNTLGSAETTVGAIYGPAYASAQNLTSPTLQLAVSRNSSQSTETWKAYVYDYDPSGSVGNGVLLWTSGTATQSASSASNVSLAFTSPPQKTIAANHRVKIVVVASGTSGNTANLYARTSSSIYSAFTVTEAPAGPSVVSASPATGNPGQALDVTITGTSFVSGAVADFGSTDITVSGTTFNSATSLTAHISIAAGAATGPRTVKVTNPDTTNGSASVFTVVSASAPTIATATPSVLGQGASNVNVAITGTNFNATSTVSDGTGVTVNSTTFVDSTHLTANISVLATATTGAHNLTVTNTSDGSNSSNPSALTISAKPTVTSALPAGGALGWTGNVAITGTGFVSGATPVVVFSGTGITVNSATYVSATQITANVRIDPAAAGGSRTITVTNGDYGVSAAGGSFFVVTAPAPTITSLSTTTLSRYASNFLMTISGTNFLNSPAPTITCSAASGVTITNVTYVNANTLTFLVTNTNQSGTATFTVTDNDTQSATSGNVTFTSTRPSVTSVAPAKVATGSTQNVVITGSGFVNGSVVSFSNAGITMNGPATYNSATQMTANITVGAAATGTSSITVTNTDGGTQSGSNLLTITPVAVSSVTPSLGPGGTGNITITGQGFTAAATVAIGGGVAVNSVQYVNASTLTANVAVSAGALAGAYDVTVTVGTNSGTGTGAFTITAPPAIGVLSPASLRQGDTGVNVTINGTNFVNGCSVQFNGTGLTLNSVSYVGPTQLTANVSIAPNAPIGGQTLTIVNPDGGSTTGGSFAITVTAKTIPGAVTFMNVTNTSMTLVLPYTGDGDGDGSCTITYGATPFYELGTVTATKGNGTYSATFNNLQGGGDGAGKLYYFRLNLTDSDGIIGASQITATQPSKGSALLHNSQNTFSTKWAQGWGIDGGKYGAFVCSTCHNDSTKNIKLVNTTIQSPILENWSSSGSSSLAISYLNPATDLGNDAVHATSTNVCEACHSRTDHHRYNNPAANHNGTVDCTPCHDHNEGFLPSCQGCHSTPQGNAGYRRQIVGAGGDFFSNMSTHGKFSVLSSKTCTVCHNATTHQTFSDGVSVALVNADTGASVVYDGTPATAQATQAVCTSCHDADGATRLGVSAMAPFGSSQDFRAPANISQYWPATGGAHATKMYCFNCHGNSKGVDGSTGNPKYNGHASGLDHGLQDAGYVVTNPNVYCFNCHKANSTDPNKSFKNISTQMGLLSKHVTARCFDCHGDVNNSLDSVHSLQAGSHTAGSVVIAKNISNATGRSMLFSGNWAGASASSSIPSNSATAEYQVCFKCHAATGSGTTPDVNNSSYTNAGALTNLALEFNPNNASGHPIVTGLNNYPTSVAPKAIPVARMLAPWNVNVGTQVMSCSDCHATDSTASKGPHGSSVKWMLAGTNKAWPYTSAAANGTSSGTYFRIATYNTGTGTKDGLFCLNCHVVTGSNGWHNNSNLTGGQHGSSTSGPAVCVNCHLRVPHGGKISRLLQTTNVPGRYRAGGTTSSTSLYTRWGSATVNIKGTSMSSSYFGSSCSEHSGGSGEAW